MFFVFELKIFAINEIEQGGSREKETQSKSSMECVDRCVDGGNECRNLSFPQKITAGISRNLLF